MATAGDLLIAAVDTWAEHAIHCPDDNCPECDARFNQVVLARKVWKISSHQAPSDALEELHAYRRWAAGEPFQCSSDITESPSYGYGELDANGFWEFPLPAAFVGRLDEQQRYRRAYETLELCPDHRDKATGRCIVCVAEARTRIESRAAAKRQSGEIVKENGTTPPSGDDTVALARLVVDLLGRCQLYGQADALRDTAARLLTILVDTEANQ